MAEDKQYQLLKELLGSTAKELKPDYTLLALLEVQKSIGKTEAELTSLQGTIADHGKKIGRIEKLLIYVAGIVTAQGLFGKSLMDFIKALTTTTPSP